MPQDKNIAQAFIETLDAYAYHEATCNCKSHQETGRAPQESIKLINELLQDENCYSYIMALVAGLFFRFPLVRTSFLQAGGMCEDIVKEYRAYKAQEKN